MKRTALAVTVGAIMCVPAVMLGEALHFGGLAWLGLLVLLMLITSLLDREYFYGPRDSG